ncbi:MAG TPA: MFS transporter [Vicinamibacterales bacterium]|nr:MFS transporter [Vicinamibacterales bacterium]
MLAWISLAELLGMSLWFAGTAVAPALAQQFSLGPEGVAWLTMAVQLGFVVGTLLSAAINLPDIVPPRVVFAGGCAVGAAATASALVAPNGVTLVAGRFLTGVALACVYPPAMKIAAGWTVTRRGTALGLLIGALTLGSAGPHLLAAFAAPVEWRPVMIAVSAQALAGALIMLLLVRDGPHVLATSRFDPAAIFVIFRNARARAATLGYLGHMWELYGCWTWIAAFGAASAAAHAGASSNWGPLTASVTLAAGAPACLLAGIVADRIGKARVARQAMIASATLAACTPALFGRSPWLLFAAAALWGAFVIADSAQFSALVAQFCDPGHVGTALTLQTSAGFLLTMVSIRVTGLLAEAIGWQWALAHLAVGPVLGSLVIGKAAENLNKTA